MLTPLAEIMPQRRIGGRSVTELLAAATDETIRRDDAATDRLKALLAG